MVLHPELPQGACVRCMFVLGQSINTPSALEANENKVQQLE